MAGFLSRLVHAFGYPPAHEPDPIEEQRDMVHNYVGQGIADASSTDEYNAYLMAGKTLFKNGAVPTIEQIDKFVKDYLYGARHG